MLVNEDCGAVAPSRNAYVLGEVCDLEPEALFREHLYRDFLSTGHD